MIQINLRGHEIKKNINIFIICDDLFDQDYEYTCTSYFYTGVPRINGTKHSSEIARLSLDILYYTTRLEIPGRPSENYKIRIGCHSGIIASIIKP